MLKRYEVYNNYDDYDIVEEPEGTFVKYEDFIALLSKLRTDFGIPELNKLSTKVRSTEAKRKTKNKTKHKKSP